MADDMGTFRVDLEIEKPGHPSERRTLQSVLVDTGAELSWFPAPVLESLGIERIKEWRFRQADGTVLARWTGGVIVRVAGIETLDEVVFGEPGDLILLGSRSLEGMNLRIDPLSKRLIDAGPAPAAATTAASRAPTIPTSHGCRLAPSIAIAELGSRWIETAPAVSTTIDLPVHDAPVKPPVRTSQYVPGGMPVATVVSTGALSRLIATKPLSPREKAMALAPSSHQ